MSRSPLTVLIVGSSFGFPYGQGAAARAYMYAKAVRHAGADARVVTVLPPARGDSNWDEAVSGVYEGIPYEYACGTRTRPGSFLERRLLTPRAAQRVAQLIGEASRDSQGRCVVLIYSGRAPWIAALTSLAHRGGAAAVLDLCEYPLVGSLRSPWAFVLREARRSVAYAAVDGIIPISTYLDHYVAASPRPPERLLVPVMVDTAAFDPAPRAGAPALRRVMYCGALGRYLEVERAIKSFAEVGAEVPDLELVIVGYGPSDREAYVKGVVRDLGVADRVTFAGDVRREDLPRLFATADVFVLPRPAGVFSIAGLPNKLGEYLASGRPVIVNANGDIARYLDDGVSAYVVDPDDQAAFTARLRHAVGNPDEAAAVGKRGRAVALQEFDYRRHGDRLLEFFSELLAHRTRGNER